MDYDIPLWVAIVVVLLSIWLSFPGAYREESWRSFKSHWWRPHRPPPA